MPLDQKKEIVPTQVILNGNPSDIFFELVNPNGTKVMQIFGDGKVSFFGKTGQAQAAAAAGTQVAEATWSTDEINMLNTAYNALKNIGLIA